MTWDTISQIAIAIFGSVSFFMLNSPNRRTRQWAIVLGCIGQPFWYVQGVIQEQWIMMPVFVVYTLGWARGIKTQFFTGSAKLTAWQRCPEHGPFCGGDECCCADLHAEAQP